MLQVGLFIEVKPMKVRDIMTREVVSCPTETDIGTAARLMLQGRFGTLPVVDAHGRLAGVITDRDIAMAAAIRHRNASHIAVRDAMSQNVHSCFAEDDVEAALKQMEEARVRRLPVLDATWHLSGILSIDDIVLRAVDQKTGVSSAEFVKAFQRICAQPSVEPQVTA
jgi:CBS domain-containing protein